MLALWIPEAGPDDHQRTPPSLCEPRWFGLSDKDADVTKRSLVAAIACRNRSTRLYGKPLQNLDVERDVTILQQLIDCLKTLPSVNHICLGIAEGSHNLPFVDFAKAQGLAFVIGSEADVLARLIQCARHTSSSDILRVTSESPFPYFEAIDPAWQITCDEGFDAYFLDDIIDGCGFEICSLASLQQSHANADAFEKEHCTQYIRRNPQLFSVKRDSGPAELRRNDLRLTVDNPEDLILARAVYNAFAHRAPRIPVADIVRFLDANPSLILLTAPFVEAGYKTMYVWGNSK
jgi:spore coat polysaccharide biosynthesis protein SpsF